MLGQKHVECHRAKKHCKLQVGRFVDTRTPPEVGGRGCFPTMLDPSVGLCWPEGALAYLALTQCGPSLELC